MLTDFVIFAAGLSLFYAVLVLARTWFGPFNPHVEISRDPTKLPVYAAYSLLRITVAYVLSLAFTLVYGYVAAYNPRAERIMIPLLDILQSIPVLSFLPGVMLAMVALFPNHQIGVEMGAILLIFTGQVWNMAFSFYSSLKSIPRDMREAAKIYRFNWYQRFTQFELPYAAIGLVWNSMMSVAGGWFFLMACEMFVLGDRDFRLPGLGSYLQTAASAGDTRSDLVGRRNHDRGHRAARPDRVASGDRVGRKIQDGAGGKRRRAAFVVSQCHGASRGLRRLRKKTIRPLQERLALHFARLHHAADEDTPPAPWKVWTGRAIALIAVLAVLYAVTRAIAMLTGLNAAEYRELLTGAGATFLRVVAALAIGAAWTIPAGVAIGFNPKLARIAQPLAQIAASVPATALFPIVLLVLIRIGGGLGLGSIVLLLLGTQWYILFNVIAGAMAIPTDLKEASSLCKFSSRTALAQIDSARHLSLSHHRTGHRFRRRLERQHRRRISASERPDLHHGWSGRHHLARHRLRQLRSAAGLDHRHVHRGRHHQPPGLAAHVPAGRDALHAGNLRNGVDGGIDCQSRQRALHIMLRRVVPANTWRAMPALTF